MTTTITLTDAAREKFQELLAAKNEDNLSLWLAIKGRGATDFIYDLRIVNIADRKDDDTLVETDGLTVIIDAASAENLNGANIHFDAAGGGFKIENPNPLWGDDLAGKIQAVIETEINPAIASHGGFITLLDVKDNVVYIQMGGGCVGCGMVDVTLKQGVEVMIKKSVPEITAVVDTTDHASGTNPYYQGGDGPQHSPAKGGGAPGHSPAKGAPGHSPSK